MFNFAIKIQHSCSNYRLGIFSQLLHYYSSVREIHFPITDKEIKNLKKMSRQHSHD